MLIEHLRSGVPMPPGQRPLTAGRAGLLAEVGGLLGAVASTGSRAFALHAKYGQGKTHALRSIWHLASERAFVVSNVTLTRECPLDRLDKVYPKVLADTYLPGASQPGIDRLITGLDPSSEQAAALLQFARRHLHPKLHAVLRNLLFGRRFDSVEDLQRDLAFVSGGMGTAELRRLHRDNFSEPLKLDRFSAQRDVQDYFRLVDFLARLSGYAGWVILFDEVELLSGLGRGARAKAYANIGRMAARGLGCEHLLTVFAVADNFYEGVLVARHDLEVAPRWLSDRAEKLGADAPEACEHGLAVLQNAVLLEALTPANWAQIMQQVIDGHEAAYGWRSGVNGQQLRDEVQRLVPETDAATRIRLRAAVQWLDVVMQYGRAPQVRLANIGEPPVLPEGAWEEAAAGSDD